MTNEKHWGARPEDWDCLDLICGLTADLLPVVSNLTAKISPRSDIEELGKIPSQYNRRGFVSGFPQWTSHVATDADIARGQREPDYGICLQTRHVRAIDCDVTDPALAGEVEAFIDDRWGAKGLPRRGRSNSSKFLRAFRMAGDFRKRSFRISDGNLLEFLGGGNQFVCVGRHPSGVRYEWRDELPSHFPKVQAEEFEALWAALVERFGNGEKTVARGDAQTRPAGKHALTIEDLREMLIFVRGGERQHWLRVLWALRSAWRESSAGLNENAVLALADAYSRRGDTGTYKDAAYVRARFVQKDTGVTWKTLLWLAWQGGWRPTITQHERLQGSMVDDFNNIECGDGNGIE